MSGVWRKPVSQMYALALNTFREAVRSRIFYILMAFAAAMVLLSGVMAVLTVGSRSKIILDLGLTVISFFSVLTAVFVGIGLVYQEVEKKTIYNILSKPVTRSRFLLGRYLGLMAVLFVNLSAMTALLSGVLLLFGGFTWKISAAVIFIYLELAVLTAVALFFSSVASPVVSAICTGAVYLVGHTSNTLPELLAPKMAEGFSQSAVKALYHLLPDLNMLNLTNQIAYDIPVPAGYLVKAVLYSVLYVVLLLSAACFAFRRRDLV